MGLLTLEIIVLLRKSACPVYKRLDRSPLIQAKLKCIQPSSTPPMDLLTLGSLVSVIRGSRRLTYPLLRRVAPFSFLRILISGMGCGPRSSTPTMAMLIGVAMEESQGASSYE